MVAIIGGTGVGDLLLAESNALTIVPTPYGQMRARRHASGAWLVARHGRGHRLPPHRVNYLALADGLKRLGVEYCFSTAAVGSLQSSWPSGTLCVCSDFLELSGRASTAFDESVVHTDFTEPFDTRARQALLDAARETGQAVVDGGVYVEANGPRYETPAEIAFYTRIGGELVGMTASSEAIAMGEAGIGYACLAIVSNLAAGMAGQELSHEEVVDAVRACGKAVSELLLKAAERLM